jgi:hypothetical protein
MIRHIFQKNLLENIGVILRKDYKLESNGLRRNCREIRSAAESLEFHYGEMLVRHFRTMMRHFP